MFRNLPPHALPCKAPAAPHVAHLENAARDVILCRIAQFAETGSMQQPVTISVVIPTLNGAALLPIALAALNAQRALLHEVIVVDDCSTDNTAGVAEALGATVVRLTEGQHANYCRNLGARTATGDILLFLDHDVVVQENTIQEVHAAFAGGALDAMVGLYSARHRNPAFASQYKNFWIRYSYLLSGSHIDWIFGAVSAIRREVFHGVGGFDRLAMFTIGIDDLELGKRITRSDIRIAFNPKLEVEHLKSYTLGSLLANDFDRSVAFVRLAGSLGQLGGSVSGGFVNIYPLFIFGTVLSWPLLLSGAAAFIVPEVVWVFLALLLSWKGLALPFLLAFLRQYGLRKTAAAAGVLFLDHLVCALGVGVGVVTLPFRRWRNRPST
jgi:glycosyltransferase involved in cell wall biosynthesis